MGSRVLDAAEDGLVLPDPDVLTCAHVALPLADLAPDLCHPVTGEPLSRIAAALAAAVDIQVVDTPRLTPADRSTGPTP